MPTWARSSEHNVRLRRRVGSPIDVRDAPCRLDGAGWEVSERPLSVTRRRRKWPHLWFVIVAGLELRSSTVWITWRGMQFAARLMLVLEGAFPPVLAILLLAAIVILTQVPLSLQPFTPEPDHGWAGMEGYGIVFAVLSYAGFEGATTLGEETPKSRTLHSEGGDGDGQIAGTHILCARFLRTDCRRLRARSRSRTLGRASAPLDLLATSDTFPGTFAGLLDLAAATSALACAIGSLSASARMLYALARAGAAPSLAKVDVQYDTPARSIAVTGAVNLVCLFLWAARSDAMSYSGNIVTVGTYWLLSWSTLV